MSTKLLIVGFVAVAAMLGGDWLEKKIGVWLKLDPTNTMGAKAVKYGSVGAVAMATYYVVDKYVK
jgi:hypothetical protein